MSRRRLPPLQRCRCGRLHRAWRPSRCPECLRDDQEGYVSGWTREARAVQQAADLSPTVPPEAPHDGDT